MDSTIVERHIALRQQPPAEKEPDMPIANYPEFAVAYTPDLNRVAGVSGMLKSLLDKFVN